MRRREGKSIPLKKKKELIRVETVIRTQTPEFYF